jgi:hypothetical protein
VRDAAQVRLAQVEPRLARLTVQAPDGAEVILDGRPLEAALLGVAIPVDPGLHTINARHADETFFVREVILDEAGADEIAIVAPPATDAVAAGDAGTADAGAINAAPEQPGPPVRAAALQVDSAAPASTPIYRRWWFWAAAGAAVLAAGAAAVLARPQSAQPEMGNVGTVHVGN